MFPGLPAFAVFLLSAGGQLPGSVLETEHYVIELSETCPEFSVGDCTASYLGKNKTTGASIRLEGKSVMALCKDNATPCHFTCYQFPSGAYTYFVYPDGDLRVTKGGHVVAQEHGSWRGSGA